MTECKGCADVNVNEETIERVIPNSERQRCPIPLYFVSSTENLTNFFGEAVLDSGPTSRDGRPCDDGIILVILEKRRGVKNEL